MTCKIDRTINGTSLVIFRVSGRITERDVDMIRAVLEPESNPLAIDLKQVVLADREAVRFLAACELNGTELRNCPAYIREWVTREGSNKNANRGTGTSDVREDA
jgi:hypothetical protein